MQQIIILIGLTEISFKNFLLLLTAANLITKNKIGEFKYIDIKDLVNNIRNNAISEIYAKKGINTLNEIKNAEIIKYKKRTPKHKELLNLFNDLLDTILIDKTLMSSKDENEKQIKLLNNDNNANAKIKKPVPIPKKNKRDENKNIVLEYMRDDDDKLFKKYSNGKNFNSFINKFDHATNK